jgi:hypothetical protein
MAARLQQYCSAAVDERLHQRVHFGLEQRFTPCYLDKGAIDPFNFGEYLVKRLFLSFVKCVCGIAPGTAQIAGGQTNEHTRATRV